MSGVKDKVLRLIYFKKSGKYYSEGVLKFHGASGYEDWSELRRQLYAMPNLPGLSGPWKDSKFTIVVLDGPCPHLLEWHDGTVR